ncbi:extracellular thaumatin domain protein [Aspergillus eucalypticola CBS 122712]|uniref:Extracellular thaumatin domain protein n=1 Tax=Aspergillus eucalypticola (strain CBS 122712 / IBT 29274) TaxID=1448314 RepID=A0A317VER4_ASPEC|nr:extracellular thaumatin domain protein [Aspergillus eucalypticola CBS 122712]PWY72846.1 extracellular thaumatin domain protein [Aspergillus eucalypticola CBS 122712]
MFFKTILTAALATAATALPHSFSNNMVRRNDTSSGSGGVSIVNNMSNTTVYAWSVSDRVSNMHTLSAGGGSYSESWQSNDNGGGISIKLSTTESQSDVLQFEYTEDGDTIYWDMSCINLGSDSAFTKYGFSVTPSEEGDNCPSVTCEAGDTECAEAYNQPDDNEATHGCPIDTQFTLTLG